MEICVIGLGYIGLPTASLLAAKGYDVHGVDINEHVVKTINDGKVHIVEPSLDLLVKSAVNSGKLHADTKPKKSDVFIMAVPTPITDDNRPDITYVEAATKKIAPYLKGGDLFIIESTSPVGTTEKMLKILRQERPDLTFPNEDGKNAEPNPNQVYVAYCPERVLPGKVLQELVENDRTVGGIDLSSTKKAKQFYATFVNGEILETNARTAEMSKLTENSFRDVNIAFANELSLICDRLDINVWELIELANHHPRVKILRPGVGVGGHCIAVDPWFIVDSAPEESRLIRTAREVNKYKTKHVITKILEKANKFKHPTIAVLGLAFKPNIDDLRESPAVEVLESIQAAIDCNIVVVEPNINELPKKLSHKNTRLLSLNEALEASDVVCLLVAHDDFKKIDPKLTNEKIVIDTQGIL